MMGPFECVILWANDLGYIPGRNSLSVKYDIKTKYV